MWCLCPHSGPYRELTVGFIRWRVGGGGKEGSWTGPKLLSAAWATSLEVDEARRKHRSKAFSESAPPFGCSQMVPKEAEWWGWGGGRVFPGTWLRTGEGVPESRWPGCVRWKKKRSWQVVVMLSSPDPGPLRHPDPGTLYCPPPHPPFQRPWVSASMLLPAKCA